MPEMYLVLLGDSTFPYWILQEKGWRKKEPQSTKPLWECSHWSAFHEQVPFGADWYSKASWLWRKFCLKTLTWSLVFSFAQRICSVLRACTESWHSSFLGTRVFASVLLTCWLSLIAFFVFKKNSFPLGRFGSALFCRKNLYTVYVYNLSFLSFIFVYMCFFNLQWNSSQWIVWCQFFK